MVSSEVLMVFWWMSLGINIEESCLVTFLLEGSHQGLPCRKWIQKTWIEKTTQKTMSTKKTSAKRWCFFLPPTHYLLSMYDSQSWSNWEWFFPVNSIKTLVGHLNTVGTFKLWNKLNDAMAQTRHAVLGKDLQHQPLCQDRGLRM